MYQLKHPDFSQTITLRPSQRYQNSVVVSDFRTKAGRVANNQLEVFRVPVGEHGKTKIDIDMWEAVSFLCQRGWHPVSAYGSDSNVTIDKILEKLAFRL